MRISQNLLQQGLDQYNATMAATGRRPRDPVITPFVMAMKIAGYTEVLLNRCSKLRACPICPVGKGNYSQLYDKNGQQVWACPHCQNITPEQGKYEAVDCSSLAQWLVVNGRAGVRSRLPAMRGVCRTVHD